MLPIFFRVNFNFQFNLSYSLTDFSKLVEEFLRFGALGRLRTLLRERGNKPEMRYSELHRVCAETWATFSTYSGAITHIELDNIPHFSMENGGTPFPNEGQTIWKDRIHE